MASHLREVIHRKHSHDEERSASAVPKCVQFCFSFVFTLHFQESPFTKSCQPLCGSVTGWWGAERCSACVLWAPGALTSTYWKHMPSLVLHALHANKILCRGRKHQEHYLDLRRLGVVFKGCSGCVPALVSLFLGIYICSASVHIWLIYSMIIFYVSRA